MERAAGRLLRAPDHDAGTGGDGGDAAAAAAAAESGSGDGGDAAAAAAAAADDTAPDLGAPAKDAAEGGAGEDTRSDEEKAAEAAKAELFGVPAEGESYQIEGLPEGMEVDKDALAAIEPVARELGLSSKGLSRIATVYAESVLPSLQTKFTTDLGTKIAEQQSTWETEARAAVAGKDGAGNPVELKSPVGSKLSFDGKPMKEVMQVAARALDHLAPVGFREWLTETGLGKHPGMIAFAYLAGKAIKEETDFEAGGAGDGKPKSRVEKYYG